METGPASQLSYCVAVRLRSCLINAVYQSAGGLSIVADGFIGEIVRNGVAFRRTGNGWCLIICLFVVVGHLMFGKLKEYLQSDGSHIVKRNGGNDEVI